jgi:aquaporin Z
MSTATTDTIPARQRATLRGPQHEQPQPQPRSTGWHPVDSLCELGGTAAQLFLGFGVVALLESPSSPVPAHLGSGVRLLIIGACFGLFAAGVALSPIGRRSGAHLNPIVTLAFAVRGHTPPLDALGYCVAQAVGALIAAAAFAGVWGDWASSVGTARTAPEPSLPAWGVVGIEAALTFGLVMTILVMVSARRTARWTPAVVTAVLAGLVWAGARHTGASMNPARTLGPDLVSGSYPVLWAYFAGPTGGALAAVAGYWLASGGRHTLTAKLFHDERYPSVHATTLPARRSPPGHGDAAHHARRTA